MLLNDAQSQLNPTGVCRADFLEHQVDLTYGTIRWIEPDRDSFLPWARGRQACVVCNLHVRHTPEGIRKAKADFQRIIDRAIEHGGHYYLTYHRWARRDQVLRCYPELGAFFELKDRYDPAGRFQSEWYRHHRRLLNGEAEEIDG
ncbi:MAG: hypothetical protein AAGG38_13765 [Planctomycetota bacterium]